MHQLSRFVGIMGLIVWGTLICVIGLVILLSVGGAEAKKPGLPLCLDQLATCQTDLDACEAASNVVFPGDGQVGLDHGPALSYTDNGDGTFTDNNTQLIWEKKNTVSGSIHNVNNLYQYLGVADGSLFTTFLATLNTAPCFAGHCDWRIPTIKELQSIVDYSKAPQLSQPLSSVPGEKTCVGTTAASELTQGFFWSSTDFADSPEGAWGIGFSDGFMLPGVGDGCARAVRGGF